MSASRRLISVPVLLCLMVGAALAVVITASSARAGVGAPTGLHVVGNQLLDGSGDAVVLRGVDRSGTEYACIQDFGIFDGPSDAASISAMASWDINAVRVPLNEDCWLGINGAPAAYSGAAYQTAIEGYVSRLHAAGLVAILDLHWTAAGTAQSTGQQDMPDADHAPAFWTSVATAFKADTSTVFDLFNEPHDVSWTCWLNGGDCGIGYTVAGMQTLVNAVRATGATNPVMVGGLAYANDLSSWLQYRPTDPTGNLMASWHSYNFNTCDTASCWDSQIAPVAAAVPLVTGEVGENDCATGYLDSLLPWLDSHDAGYLGWGWDTYDCSSFPALISDYSGTPTAYGAGLRNHLIALAGTTPPSTTTTSTTVSTTTTTAPPSTTTTTTPPTTVPGTTSTTRPTTPPTTRPPTTTTTRPTTPPTTSKPGGPVVHASALTSSAPWWWEEDLALTPAGPVTRLRITISVAQTKGIAYYGFYTTAPQGVLATSEASVGGRLVFTATLNPGQSLPAGYGLQLGAQYSGNGTAHSVTGDTYQVSTTIAGQTSSSSGRF